MFSRATSRPADTSAGICPGPDVAGPRVPTIFARRLMAGAPCRRPMVYTIMPGRDRRSRSVRHYCRLRSWLGRIRSGRPVPYPSGSILPIGMFDDWARHGLSDLGGPAGPVGRPELALEDLA